MSFLSQTGSDLRTIYAAAFLHSAGVGMTGVLLGVYLGRAGFSTAEMGVVPPGA